MMSCASVWQQDLSVIYSGFDDCCWIIHSKSNLLRTAHPHRYKADKSFEIKLSKLLYFDYALSHVYLILQRNIEALQSGFSGAE